MPNQIIELTKEQFESGELTKLCNHVLVEVTQSNDGKTTKSGIIVGLEHRHNYDNNAQNADMQECWGRVAQVPSELYYNEDDPKSMDYETEMELVEDDLVWGGILEFNNAPCIMCKGRDYRLIPYADLYVAKRECWVDKWSGKKATKVIVLNGLTLCQSINRTKISELDFISEGQIDASKVVVRYVGEPNKRYKNKSYVDHQDVREGDVVLLQPRTSMQYLERKSYFSNFNGDELYLVIPRRKIVAVIERESDAVK